jgi:O-antigen ligase
VVRWRIGPLPTTLLETLILVTIAAYVATLWAERRPPAARTFLDIPIALLLIAGIIGILVAPDYAKALGIYRAYFLEAIVIFYIAVDMLRTERDLRTVLLVAGAGMSLFALGEIITFAIAFSHHAIKLTDAPAFLNTSPNSVSLFLEPPLAFAIGFVMFPSARRERWLALAALALLLPADVMTLSRAGYLALAVLGVVLVVTVPAGRWRLGAVAVLATMALVVLELPLIGARIDSLARSVVLRSSLYDQAWRMLSERPVQGAGISGFPVRVAPFRPANQMVQLYPHDVWLTTWSELGLLGLAAFAVIFFSLLWRGWRAVAGATGLWRPLIWGAAAALVLYLVHGLFDSPYWKNDLSVEFWLLAALEVVALRAVRSAAQRR